ncbi:MAG: CBS domain-containing protein [Candidatus Aenigmatarchaeota archaeon]|nr:MAG: CBS domain-containing protein [Candidatus Aenigmarchaeota archaeon]
MQVKDVMTKEVKTISPEASIQEAAKTMNHYNIGCLVVSENEILKGILTERDILRNVVAENLNPSDTKVKDAMSVDIVFIEPDADLEDAVEAMLKNKVKRLPVIDKNRLIGIISTMDIISVEPKMVEQIAKLVLLPVHKKLTAG